MSEDEIKLFEFERAGETVVLSPNVDLRGLAFQQLNAEANEIFEILNQTPGTNLIVDCHKTNFFGSVALGFFVKLRQRVHACNGRMAFCNVSEIAKEILFLTKTDRLWFICSSRSDALEVLRTTDAN